MIRKLFLLRENGNIVMRRRVTSALLMLSGLTACSTNGCGSMPTAASVNHAPAVSVSLDKQALLPGTTALVLVLVSDPEGDGA